MQQKKLLQKKETRQYVTPCRWTLIKKRPLNILPFQVGGLEVLLAACSAAAAASPLVPAAVDADDDEEEEGEDGPDAHSDEGLLGHVVWRK